MNKPVGFIDVATRGHLIYGLTADGELWRFGRSWGLHQSWIPMSWARAEMPKSVALKRIWFNAFDYPDIGLGFNLYGLTYDGEIWQYDDSGGADRWDGSIESNINWSEKGFTGVTGARGWTGDGKEPPKPQWIRVQGPGV